MPLLWIKIGIAALFEPEKLADLVVLSGNFEECSDDELADLVVDVTVIAGNVVFAR